MSKKKKYDKIDSYEVITNAIIAQMERGNIPWHKPWSGSDANAPRNPITKTVYSGINHFMLSCAPYTSPYWVTFAQAKDKGGHVRKGEKHTPVIWWFIVKYDVDGNPINKNDKKTKVHSSQPFLKHFKLFNAEQIDGMKFPEVATTEEIEFDSIEKAEEVVANYTLFSAQKSNSLNNEPSIALH